MRPKTSFQDGRVRLPAFVLPGLKTRLKTLATQDNMSFQEYLEKGLERLAEMDEKSREAKKP